MLQPTDDTRVTKLLLQYGKLSDPEARMLVELSFTEHQDTARRDPRLPLLYAERDLLKSFLAAGALTSSVSGATVPGEAPFQGGFFDWREADVAEEHSQRGELLRKLLADLDGPDGMIAMLEKRAAANRGGAVGEITRKSPVVVPDDRPYPIRVDPNEPAYRGDAIRRVWPR